MKLKNQIKNPLIRFPRSALYSGLRLYKIQFTSEASSTGAVHYIQLITRKIYLIYI